MQEGVSGEGHWWGERWIGTKEYRSVEVLMSTASGVNKKDAGNVIIPFLVH